MGYRITQIEGIGPAYRKKLSAASISNTEHLLKLCCDRKGRKAVSGATGLSEKHLLNWANKADLMRIRGVGPQFSELLEAAGVDTVKELRNRKADNLAETMAKVNARKKLARTSPSAKLIEGWIRTAKRLKPLITH